ncbi:hypothetical protein TKK_0001993 [Trichogramma kaykai]
MGVFDRRRFNLNGKTRWWAKDAALKKIFSPTGNREKSLLVELLVVFEIIEANSKTKPDTRSCAKAYTEAFLKYESVLTAFVLQAIFDQKMFLSNYLQKINFDILKAFNLVKLSTKNVEKIREEFPKIKKQADQFIEWTNQKLEERDTESIILSNFTEERVRTKKILSGEKARDHVFENVKDNAISAMPERFDVLNNTFYADITLETFTLKLQSFFTCRNSNINAESLRQELLKLTESWDVIQSSVLEKYEVRNELRETEEEEQQQLLHSKKENQNKTKHESFACERSFSHMKNIKTRLRNSMNQDKLGSFMLMAIEGYILEKLKVDNVIDELVDKSSTL